MLSWPQWKCNLDWKGCDRKHSRRMWSTMLIRRDDTEWRLDLIWGALWIRTYSVIIPSWRNLKCYVDWKGCDRNISRRIWSTIWIRRDNTGWRLDLICGALWNGTNMRKCCNEKKKCYVDWIFCDRKISWPIWSNMWISTDDREWCLT
jgi:hypothetical protein